MNAEREIIRQIEGTFTRDLLVINPPEQDNDEELKDYLITIMKKTCW